MSTSLVLPASSGKWPLLFVLSVPLAISLFVIMAELTSPRDVLTDRQENLQRLDYVRVIPNEQVREKRRELPPKQKKASTPPPRPVLETLQVKTPQPTLIDVPNLILPMSLNKNFGLGGLAVSSGDGNVIPLVKIAPSYPRQARTRGIEGWVKVGIKISKTGSVLDVEILEAEPRRIFDRTTIRAVFRWKFKPEVVEGQTVENYSTQVIHFALDKNK